MSSNSTNISSSSSIPSPFVCFGVYICKKCGLELFNATSIVKQESVAAVVAESESQSQSNLAPATDLQQLVNKICFEKPIKNNRLSRIPIKLNNTTRNSVFQVCCSKCQVSLGIECRGQKGVKKKREICIDPAFTQLVSSTKP